MEEGDVMMYMDPYMLNNRAVIVKGWSPEFNFNEEVLRTIPLWI